MSISSPALAARRAIVTLGLLSLTLSSHAQTPAQGHLQLEIHLAGHHAGRVAWAVYKSADGFPNDKFKSVRRGFSSPAAPDSTVDIDAGQFSPGNYAVAAYLDENGNGKLDTRFPGIPKEPVGASNNPPKRLGPPRFNDCVFALGPEGRTVPIRLVEPK